MPNEVAQPSPTTSARLSNKGLTRIITLLNSALSNINSAECVYIDEKVRGNELKSELRVLWQSAYRLREKYNNIPPSINNSND